MADPTGAMQLPLPLEVPVAPALDEEVLAAALADPVIVWPGWESTMPGWIWQAITEERLARLATGDGDGLATLAEALAYLYCAGLAAPLNHEWAEIYCNLAARYMAARGAILPEDMQPRPFTEYEETLLRDFRWDIRHAQKRERRKRRRRVRQGDKVTP